MASNILGAAFTQYGLGTGSKGGTSAAAVKNPDAQYEYGQKGRTGVDTDHNGFREVDCSVLVYNALRNAGYYLPDSSAAGFTTQTLFSGDNLTKTATDNFTSFKAEDVFSREADLQPGDILLFKGVNGNTSQHVAIFYGYDENKQMMFYGSQTSTGPGVASFTPGNEKEYWGGKDSKLIGALRPNESLYIPEMDLTGGAGTGLGSANVMTAVNLLKQDNVEGYRANIYSNADGVPTVGNGLTFVVKGTGGQWTVLPENQIKDLLRDAGLPESKYNDLPLDKLSQSASLLNQGLKDQAKAVFGKGEEGGFSVTPAEADKLSAAYIVRDVVPRLANTLGVDDLQTLEPGEFAAVASKIYQSPGWLKTQAGKDFVKAWSDGDDAAAQAALGTGNRGRAEASAYEGNINTTNNNLSVATGPSSSPPIGHWEEQTIYTDLGIPMGTTTAWVLGPGPASPPSGTAPVDTPPGNHTTTGAIYLSRDGASATLPDGKVINAGQGGRLELGVDGNLTATRPVAGYGPNEMVYSVTLYNKAGQATARTQVQVIADPNHPNDPAYNTTLVQGQARDITPAQPDGTSTVVRAVFQTGFGWIEPGTGEIVQTLAQWAEEQHPLSDFEKALLDAFRNPPAPPDDPGIQPPDDPGIQYADAGQHAGITPTPTATDAGPRGPDLPPNQQAQTATDAQADFRQDEIAAQNSQGAIEAAATAAQLQAAATLGLINTIIGLRNWDQQSDIGHASTLVGIYNQINAMNGGQLGASTGLGSLSGVGAGLGLLSALESGNVGGILSNGIALGNAVFNGAVSNNIASALGLAEGAAGNVIPGIGLVMALDSGDPLSIVTSVLAFIPGWGQAAAAVLSIFGGDLFGDDDPPPPPEGIVSYRWNADGSTQLHIDANQSSGADTALTIAGQIQDMLNAYVQNINARQAGTADDVAINPYLIPRVGFSNGQAWIEVHTPDGQLIHERMNGATLGGRVLGILINSGGLAPAWQIETQQQHWLQQTQELKQLQDAVSEAEARLPYGPGESNGDQSAGQGPLLTTVQTYYASGDHNSGYAIGNNAADVAVWQAATAAFALKQAQIERGLFAGQAGDNAPGGQAWALQGNAVESADFTTQHFGALVVHSQQALQTTLTAVLRNADADGYLEQSQWLAANDRLGGAQGLLVLDMLGDGTIETRDILNLGGNRSTDGNPTTEAAQASQMADLQRNNAQWLDGNEDQVLDSRDPAFALVRYWLDGNQNAMMETGESRSLAQMGIVSIDLRSGAVNYANGQQSAMTALTLQAATDGIRMTQIQQVTAEGTLLTLDAGVVLEHEGYQGKVLVSDSGGARWVGAREQWYEQDAKRTGDWEGTAEQEAHRHGGGNVADAPTQTSVTSVASAGEVLRVAAVAPSVVSVDDERLQSDPQPDAAGDAPAGATGPEDAQIEEGDARIRSAPPARTIAAAPAPRAFVPVGAVSAAQEMRQVMLDRISSADSGVLGGLGAPLVALASGAAVVQWPQLASAQQAGEVVAEPLAAPGIYSVVSSPTFSTSESILSAAVGSEPINAALSVSFRQVDLGSFQIAPAAVEAMPSLTARLVTSWTNTEGVASSGAAADATAASGAASQALVSAAVSSAPITVAMSATPDVVLDYPTITGERISGIEDIGLRLNEALLLDNDSTLNDSGLHIVAVGSPHHGQVSLRSSVDASGVAFTEVVFIPDANFHGEAGFGYTVSDDFGLQTSGWATLDVQAVNDVPVTQDDAAAFDEDHVVWFSTADLLANDSDVDSTTDGQQLSIVAVGHAQHGTVRLSDDGQAISFTPDADYFGPASFSYTVSDGTGEAGGTAQASVFLTVQPVNDAPLLADESTTSLEDERLLIPVASLLANDSDVDDPHASLVVVSVQGATHGTVRLVAAQNGDEAHIEFTPDANYHGSARFSYTVQDPQGATSTATEHIAIAAVKDAPVAQGEALTSLEDAGLLFTQAQLLANDSDVDTTTDGDTLHISRVGLAQHGQAWLDSDGSVRFLPDQDYHGPAGFSYWAADAAGLEAQASVSITVAAVNDLPVPTGEELRSNEDTILTINPADLLANDSDVDTATDGQVLTISAVSNAQHGSVALLPDGQIRFVPEADFNGLASFTYTVSDGAGGVATATAVLNLAAVNDAPVALGETASGDEDTTLRFTAAGLLANDGDVDVASNADVLHISRVSDALHGTVSLQADGSVQFVPEHDYFGAASFRYWVADLAGLEVPATVNLTLVPVNDAPVVADELTDGDEDVALSFAVSDLLANDSDVDNLHTDLSIVSAFGAQHGSVMLVTGLGGVQRVVFTPEANYFGTAGFTYMVSDGAGGQSTGTVVLRLAEVNDAPVVQADALPDGQEDTVIRWAPAVLLANDSDVDGDTLTVASVGQASGGTVALVGGEIVFTPTADYYGPASFVYTASDGRGGSRQALATLSLRAVNDAPVGVNETIAGVEDQGLLISQAALLQNEIDVDNAHADLRIVAVGNAQHGTVQLQADGAIRFVPDADYAGTARFGYTVSDAAGGLASAEATIVLSAVNDAPVALGERMQGTEDQGLVFTQAALLANDSDVDNTRAELVIGRVGEASHGAVSMDASGQVRFTPAADYAGPASFSYWVRDPAGLESKAGVNLTLAAVNDAPYAQGETLSGASEDAVFSISQATLLANDGDVDNASADLSVVLGSPSHGTVQLAGDGRIVFTPTANYNGAASFTYQVRDLAGLLSPTVTAAFTVAAVNDIPVAVDDQFATYSGSQMTVGFGQLTGNDKDADQDALTVSAVRNHAHGNAWISNGAVRFDVEAGFAGLASFDYLVDDSHGGQTWGTAYVDVYRPPNLYPTLVTSASQGSAWYRGASPAEGWFLTNYYYTPVDDGDPNAITITYAGGSYQNPYDWQWLDMPSSGASVVLDTNVRQMVFDFSWAYYGVFSAFTTSWILTDDHGLQNVFHYGVTGYQWNSARNTYEFTTSIYNEHTGYALPIVLNLDGQGIKYTEVRDSKVRFDVDHDGVADKLAWAAAGSGVLGIDLNGDQQISDASEFSFAQYVPGATTDLQGLAAFDTNHNQQLDKGDERWGQFGVWEDKNADGQTQQGEYRTLEQLNIQSIELTSNGQASGMNTEAVVTGTTHFTRDDGSTGQAADVMLAYQSGQDVAAMAEEALLMRMALVFNQHCNTGDATAEPLAFVNWAQAGSSGHWETPTSAELDHPALLALAAGKQDTGAAAQHAALNDKALA